MKKTLQKRGKIALCITAALIFIVIVGCGIYVNDYYRANEMALKAQESTSKVTVEQSDDMTFFIPEDPSAGFIFYPGGKVEYTAYAPLLHNLAENNILCILIEMPFNLAVLDMDAAEGIPEQFPDIDIWYIGGHSLGGSMAASYAADNADSFEGIVLLASYSTADLSESSLAVFSAYGSEDNVLNMEKYKEYHSNLPDDLSETIIEGGCHAYFGSYGTQDGDGIPTISCEEQTKETSQLLLDFFNY